MPIYLVSRPDILKRDLIGVLFAPNTHSLWFLVDEITSPTECEYIVLGRRWERAGIFLSGVIPEGQDPDEFDPSDGIFIDHQVGDGFSESVVGALYDASIGKIKWKPMPTWEDVYLKER